MSYARIIVLILPLVALFLSCDEGSNTIFETIINDTPVTNLNQLGNKSNVPSMTAIVGTNTTYFVTLGGSIRYRLSTDTAWSAMSMAPGIHYTVATDGINLYAGVIDGDGNGGLYQCADPTAVSPTVNQINSIADMKYIGKIKGFPGGSVFASYRKTDTNGTYSMCAVSGVTATEISGTNVPDPITDFAFDGVNLYFVSGTNVYRGTTATPITPSASYTYTGITYDTTNSRLVVSTLNGFIYRSTDTVGNTLVVNNTSACTYTRGSSTIAVSFTEIVPLTSSLYLVGSQGAGFWIIDWSLADASKVTRWNGTAYSELYNGAIESIFIDAAAGPRVFFCTTGAGLWDNTYVTDWGATWTRE